MDILTQFALAGSVVVGIVNGFKMALDKNWKGFALFSIGLISGTILGIFHWFGLPGAEMGFAVGLFISGTYEIAQRVGGK